MMDLKHRTAYGRIKLTGVAEPVVFNDGMSLIQLLSKFLATLGSFPSRYNDIEIKISFTPINENPTNQESGFNEFMSLIDPSLIELEADDDDSWANNIINPASPTYDVLAHQYRLCSIPSHRETKTPQDLSTLRKHMESNYRDTIHWPGFHSW